MLICFTALYTLWIQPFTTVDFSWLNLDKYCFPQFLEIYSCYLVTISEQGHDSQKVLNIANQKLKNEFRIFHSTIQVELYQESVMTNCVDCQDLQD